MFPRLYQFIHDMMDGVLSFVTGRLNHNSAGK
jgi:hypothetical protein